jgi:hypothetical protein
MIERCRHIDCQSCAHYVKYLTVGTMQMICWDKGVEYEPDGGAHP